MESGSGFFTGSVFNDETLNKSGYYGESIDYRDGTTLLQKTHHRTLTGQDKLELTWRREQVDNFGGRGVVLVRNPYRAIISYWNFIEFGLQNTNVVNSSTFNTQEFNDFVFTSVYRWFELINDWINFGKDIYIVFYEELKDNPVAEIRKLLLYLGLEVDEDRLACLSKHLSGSFNRTSKDTRDPFKEEHRLIVSSVVEKVDRILQNAFNRKMPNYTDAV